MVLLVKYANNTKYGHYKLFRSKIVSPVNFDKAKFDCTITQYIISLYIVLIICLKYYNVFIMDVYIIEFCIFILTSG